MLPSLKTKRFALLETKAGTTERIHGRAWMTTRQRIAQAYNYTCARCKLLWRAHLDQIDHIVPLYKGGGNNDANLQPLCNECHSIKTNEDRGIGYVQGIRISDLIRPIDLRPSAIPLTIVCGPAGGGKSTYIGNHAKKGDIIIDMDAIRKRLGIQDDNWTQATLQRSLIARNNMLLTLSTSTARKAWFIVSASKSTEREWWIDKLKPESLVIIATTEVDCHARAIASRSGARLQRSIIAASRWWKEYDNHHNHTLAAI